MLYQTDLRCKMKRYSRSINIYFSFKQFLIDLTYSFQFKENILKYFNFLLTLKSLNLYQSIHLIFIVLFQKKTNQMPYYFADAIVRRAISYKKSNPEKKQ